MPGCVHPENGGAQPATYFGADPKKRVVDQPALGGYWPVNGKNGLEKCPKESQRTTGCTYGEPGTGPFMRPELA